MNQPIQEKAPKPPGLLPKNTQSWVLVALAILMILVMWLTGGKKQSPGGKANTTLEAAQPPLEVNETKIAEMQSRIQDLQRQQLVAQNALAQQTKLLGSSREQQAQQPLEASNQPSVQDPVQAERKKRDYLSLFASNVALSYRKPATSATTGIDRPSSLDSKTEPLPPSPDIAQVAQFLKQVPPAAPGATAMPPGSAMPQETSAETAKERHEEPATGATGLLGRPNPPAGRTYVIFEGTILETVLVNRLEGQFAGPVVCQLTSDVYSHDRQHVLIPAGTKILGETKRVDNSGQTRLAVVFHRLIMPDGFSASLDQFKGLDQIGDSGLRDQVNNHYLRIFGVSLAIGGLGAVAEAGTGSAFTASGSDLMRQGFAQSTAQSSAQILDRFLNILPTVRIREGHRVKVYLSGDLALPAYGSHKMPSDL